MSVQQDTLLSKLSTVHLFHAFWVLTKKNKTNKQTKKNQLELMLEVDRGDVSCLRIFVVGWVVVFIWFKLVLKNQPGLPLRNHQERNKNTGLHQHLRILLKCRVVPHVLPIKELLRVIFWITCTEVTVIGEEPSDAMPFRSVQAVCWLQNDSISQSK